MVLHDGLLSQSLRTEQDKIGWGGGVKLSFAYSIHSNLLKGDSVDNGTTVPWTCQNLELAENNFFDKN